jgi:PAS domain S-box-containing protein
MNHNGSDLEQAIALLDSMEQAPVGIAILRGEEMIVEMANAFYLQMIDRNRETFVGRSLYQGLPEVRVSVKPLLDEVYSTGVAFKGSEFEVVIYKQGKRENAFFDFVYQPLRDRHNQVNGIMVVCRDVTEQVVAKHLILENERKFRNLVTYSPIAMAIFRGRDFVIEMANNTMLEKMWRRPLEAVEGKKLLDVFPELHDQPFPALLQRVYDSGEPHKEKEAPAYVDGPDGMKLFYLDFEYAPIFGVNKEVYGLMVTVYDVTERKENEIALRMTEEKFRVLADSMPQLIWTADPLGHLQFHSKSMDEYSGLTAEQLEDGGWSMIVHPADNDMSTAHWKQAIETGETFFVQHRLRKHDGTYRWQLSRGVPQRDLEGNIHMWVGTSTDIHDNRLFIDKLESQIQERTKALQRTNDDLRKTNGELAQFAYVASHDLQEPLRKIQTFASRLMDIEYKVMSDKGKDYFTRIQSSARNMQQLIEDLLSFSRTSNNGDQLFEPIDLSAVLQRAKEQLSEQIERKQAVINSDPLPTLSGISFQVEQLFTNLLNNALKFSTPSVKPVINVQIAPQPVMVDNLPYHKISISDNGIGFDPQFNERIFQVFQRLHGRNQYEGTGIGLAICKKIMDNHQGFITAESKQGEGATFTLHFPVEQTS